MIPPAEERLVALQGIHIGQVRDESSDELDGDVSFDARLNTWVMQTKPAHSEFGRVLLTFRAGDKVLEVRLRGATSMPTKTPPIVTMIGGRADGREWRFEPDEGDDWRGEFVLTGLDAASFMREAARAEKIRVVEDVTDYVPRVVMFDSAAMTSTPVQPNIEFYIQEEQRKAWSVVTHQMSIPARRFANSFKWGFVMLLIRLLTPVLNGINFVLTPLAAHVGGLAALVVLLFITAALSMVLGDQILDAFDAVVRFVRKPSWAILKPLGLGAAFVIPWFLWKAVSSDVWKDMNEDARSRRERRGEDG